MRIPKKNWLKPKNWEHGLSLLLEYSIPIGIIDDFLAYKVTKKGIWIKYIPKNKANVEVKWFPKK